MPLRLQGLRLPHFVSHKELLFPAGWSSGLAKASPHSPALANPVIDDACHPTCTQWIPTQGVHCFPEPSIALISKHLTSSAGCTRTLSTQGASGAKEGTPGSLREVHVDVRSMTQACLPWRQPGSRATRAAAQVWEAFPAERTGRTKTGGHSLLMGSSHLYLLVALLSSFYSDESQRFIGDVKYSEIL